MEFNRIGHLFGLAWYTLKELKVSRQGLAEASYRRGYKQALEDMNTITREFEAEVSLWEMDEEDARHSRR